MVQGVKVYSYNQLIGVLNGKSQKVLANNTVAHVRGDGSIGLRLHNTDVVIVHPNDTYSLFSGGYMSSTTKQRLSGLSPVTVIQKAGAWYIKADPRGGVSQKNLIPFVEGITVDRFGNVIGNRY